MAAPLDRLRILDLSRQLPGPFCSLLLSDLGADVVMIGAPGDPLGAGMTLLTRGKRSMTLDLKQPAARDAFLRLAAGADVVLEGFRPGVAARLGIDYGVLAEVNPRLVYCAITGYGQDGPYRARAGHDVNYLGQAGVLDVFAAEGGAPTLAGVQIADIGGGALMAVVGILAALLSRAVTNRGQLVDVAMLDGALTFNAYQHLLWTLHGSLPERGRTWLTGYYPCYAAYETRDGRWVTVGAFEPHFWATLCQRLGCEEFIPEQWAEGEKRAEIFRVLRERFRSRTMREWVETLADDDICFGPVNTVEEALADPQVRHRRMVIEVEAAGGRRTMLGCPIQLSETAARFRGEAPRFGAHTEEVLREVGLSAADVAALRAAGAV